MSKLVLEKNNIPKNWIFTQIQEVCETKSGGTPSRKNLELYEGGIPWVKSGELSDSLISSCEETISELGLQKSNATIFPKGTILMAMYGATIGKLGILNLDASTNQAICAFFNDKRILNSKYLFYFLKHNKENLIKSGFGGAQNNISQENIKKVVMPIPPLKEQERIVEKIEELFSKIDSSLTALQKTKFQLKYYKTSLLKLGFLGELTKNFRKNNPDKSVKPLVKKIKEIREQLEKKLQKIEIPNNKKYFHQIPDTWKWVRVGNVCYKLQYGSSEKANRDSSGIPVLRMGNIIDGKLNFNNLKFFPKNWKNKNELQLETGDVLFNRTNSAELVGKTAVFQKNHPPSVFASYLIRAKVVSEIMLPQLLSYYINSVFGRMFIKSVVSQQVGQANVNGTKFSMMCVPLIPMQEQLDLLNRIDKGISLIQNMSNEIKMRLVDLSILKSSILKQAFEGQLVPQDPNDEHAEILLQKIKQEKEKQEQKQKIIKPKSQKKRKKNVK